MYYFYAIVFVILSVLVLSSLGVIPDRLNCKYSAKKIGVEHYWGFFEGCMINTKKGWIPLANYRVID